jgi:Flp pilus assembly protein TadG
MWDGSQIEFAEDIQMKPISSRRKAQRGSHLVESSLIMMVFFATVIGVLDFGQVLFVHQSMVERARSGARYGSVNTYDADKIRNMVLFNQPQRPSGVNIGMFGLTDANVLVSRQDAETSEDRVNVTITNYQFQFVSPWIAGTVTGLPVKATLPYEYGNQ